MARAAGARTEGDDVNCLYVRGAWWPTPMFSCPAAQTSSVYMFDAECVALAEALFGWMRTTEE